MRLPYSCKIGISIAGRGGKGIIRRHNCFSHSFSSRKKNVSTVISCKVYDVSNLL